MTGKNKWPIYGHEKQLEVLQTALDRNNLSQSYIFYGPRGVGKRFTVTSLLQKLYCTQGGFDDCSVCQSIAREYHSEIYAVKPDNEGGSISVQAIREALDHVRLSSLENNQRVLIVDQAESLTPEAANSLLKTLEEPPERVHIFLITEYLSALPTTMRSRCQMIKFFPLSETLMTEWMVAQQIPREKIALAQKLALGRPGLVQELLRDDFREYYRRSELSDVLLSGTVSKAMLAISQWFKELKKSDEPNIAVRESEAQIENFQLALRDIALHSFLSSTNETIEEQKIVALQTRWSMKKLMRGMKGIEVLKKNLSQNCNPQLAWEHYLTNFLYSL